MSPWSTRMWAHAVRSLHSAIQDSAACTRHLAAVSLAGGAGGACACLLGNLAEKAAASLQVWGHPLASSRHFRCRACCLCFASPVSLHSCRSDIFACAVAFAAAFLKSCVLLHWNSVSESGRLEQHHDFGCCGRRSAACMPACTQSHLDMQDVKARACLSRLCRKFRAQDQLHLRLPASLWWYCVNFYA